MLKPVCGLGWSWGWVREWVLGGQQSHQGSCFECVCGKKKSVCPDFVILPNIFCKSIIKLEAMIFYDSLHWLFCCIKLHIISIQSYSLAIRPPLSFAFFLCPLTLQPLLLCPHSGFISFSVSAFYLLHSCFIASSWLCLSLFPASVSLLCSSLQVLVADASRALIILALLVSVSISRRSHSLSPCHRLPTAPRNKHAKWFPARGFCLKWEQRKAKRGLM